MTSEDVDVLAIREQIPVFDRMFAAVEKVPGRLERASAQQWKEPKFLMQLLVVTRLQLRLQHITVRFAIRGMLTFVPWIEISIEQRSTLWCWIRERQSDECYRFIRWSRWATIAGRSQFLWRAEESTRSTPVRLPC